VLITGRNCSGQSTSSRLDGAIRIFNRTSGFSYLLERAAKAKDLKQLQAHLAVLDIQEFHGELSKLAPSLDLQKSKARNFVRFLAATERDCLLKLNPHKRSVAWLQSTQQAVDDLCALASMVLGVTGSVGCGFEWSEQIKSQVANIMRNEGKQLGAATVQLRIHANEHGQSTRVNVCSMHASNSHKMEKYTLHMRNMCHCLVMEPSC
jgi:hypothetical protein